MITKDEQKTYLMLLDLDETINSEITKKLNKKAKLLLAVLKFYSDGFTDYEKNHDGWFSRSFELLKEVTGIGSNHTISANIKLFEKMGLIEIKQGYIIRNGKGAKVNYYRFGDKKNCTDIIQNCTDITLLKNKDLHQNCTDMNDENCTDMKNEIALTKNTLTNNENCTDITLLKNKDLHQNCTDIKKTNCTIDIDIDIEKEVEKESLNSNSLIGCENETELLNFVISFLKSETREGGATLWREFTNNNTLQDETKNLLSTYTREVAQLKGWEKETLKTTTNISNVEPQNTLQTGKKFIDWSLNLKTAKSYFYQQAERYANEWAPLSEEERRQRYQLVTDSGFINDTFLKFEPYIDGITLEKAEEFAKMVNEYADNYAEARKTTTNTTANDKDFRKKVHDVAVKKGYDKSSRAAATTTFKHHQTTHNDPRRVG